MVAATRGHLDAAHAAMLRRDQFTAMAERSAVTALCSLGSFATVMGTFWRDGSRPTLTSVMVALLLLHGAAVLRSRRWLRGDRADTSTPQLWLRVVVTILVALVWSAALFALMPVGDTDQRQLLVYIFAGLTTSGLLIAPVLPAAMAMAFIPSVAMLAVMPWLHQSIGPQHAIMIVFFLVMTIVAIRTQHGEFRRRFENALLMREQTDTIALLLRDFEESGSDWLWSVDAGFRLCGPLDRFRAVTGCSERLLASQDIRFFLDRDAVQESSDLDRFSAALEERTAFREVRLPFRFGATGFWFSLSGKPRYEDGRFVGYRGVASNVTEVQRSSDRIAYLARYDNLTGLPNRILFQESLHALTTASTGFALLCLDLDGFKPVNDTYGHAVGDELLSMVASRLRGCVREGDVVARLGGDEFAILAGSTGTELLSALPERLIATIGKPFAIRDLRISVSLSVGVVVPGEGTTVEQLMQAGDIALYASKKRGRATWSLFEQFMADAAQERHLLQNDLREAIAKDELSLAFQPIVDAVDRRVTCVEVLARWSHRLLGMVPPDRFIPLAEENGLIVPLGAWVLRRACLEASTWPPGVRVAVNLSPLQLRDPALFATIDDALAAAGLPPDRLEIEITESVFLDNAAATLERLQKLRDRGIRISLDDFGTGYSSLSYLRSFPFNKVKIDRSFVQDLGDSRQALSIVKAIVGMASSLDMDTTGEGVETPRQAEMLLMAGCDQFQGFLFGRPCTQKSIGETLRGLNGYAVS